MTEKITMTGKYRTRSGLPARVLCIDLKSEKYPVAAVIEQPDEDKVTSFSNEGTYIIGIEDDWDLVRVSEKKRGWIIKDRDSSYRSVWTDEEKEHVLIKNNEQWIRVEWEE